MKRRWRRVWPLAIPLLAVGFWMAWSGVVYAMALRVYVIPTGSMAPTLSPGDRIVVDSRPGHVPKRGELWVLTLPSRLTGVKRVVGMPGETIAVAAGAVLIDGTPLAEPYLAGPPTYAMAPVTLKPDEFFVLGDNRNASNDSHVWGPLKRSKLIGRAQYRPWPPSRMGGLP